MIFSEDINELKLNGNELKKYRQKKKILQLLYQYDSLSGSVLSKKIGVSLPTALALLNELSEMKFVEACGTGQSSGGRKPLMFRLLNESVCVIACELLRSQAKMVVYNSHNQALSSIKYFETSIDDKQLVEKIYNNAQELIKEFDLDENRIFAIGVSMPGLVDEVSGINYTINDKEYINVKKRLEKRFRKFIYVNNDARMQAYGEYIFGKAKNHSNAVIVNWNQGIGLGMILNKKLYNGSNGFAGELSHSKFVDEGDLCICGKRGCLETVASSNVLVNNAIKGIKNNVVSQLTLNYKDKLDKLNAEEIINAAKSGDEFSILLLHDLGKALGKGLSVTIQLLNPEIIVLGGIVSQAKQFILAPVEYTLNKFCLDKISSNVKIVISENWEQSGLLGITAMLFKELFSETNKNI